MIKETAAKLKAIHSQEDKEAAIQKSKLIIEKLRLKRFHQASDVIEKGIEETLS